MTRNPKRLPLLLKLGVMASQARTESHLDRKSPFTVKENDDFTVDLWESVRASLMDLAAMDIQSGFTPTASPLLSEFGLLEEYWKLREYFDSEESHYSWL